MNGMPSPAGLHNAAQATTSDNPDGQLNGGLHQGNAHSNMTVPFQGFSYNEFPGCPYSTADQSFAPAQSPQHDSFITPQSFFVSTSQQYQSPAPQSLTPAQSQQFQLSPAAQSFTPAQPQQFHSPAAQSFTLSPSQQYKSPAAQSFTLGPSQQYKSPAAQSFILGSSQQYKSPAAQSFTLGPSQQYQSPAANIFTPVQPQKYHSQSAHFFTPSQSQQYLSPAAQPFTLGPSQSYHSPATKSFASVPSQQHSPRAHHVAYTGHFKTPATMQPFQGSAALPDTRLYTTPPQTHATPFGMEQASHVMQQSEFPSPLGPGVGVNQVFPQNLHTPPSTLHKRKQDSGNLLPGTKKQKQSIANWIYPSSQGRPTYGTSAAHNQITPPSESSIPASASRRQSRQSLSQSPSLIAPKQRQHSVQAPPPTTQRIPPGLATAGRDSVHSIQMSSPSTSALSPGPAQLIHQASLDGLDILNKAFGSAQLPTFRTESTPTLTPNHNDLIARQQEMLRGMGRSFVQKVDNLGVQKTSQSGASALSSKGLSYPQSGTGIVTLTPKSTSGPHAAAPSIGAFVLTSDGAMASSPSRTFAKSSTSTALGVAADLTKANTTDNLLRPSSAPFVPSGSTYTVLPALNVAPKQTRDLGVANKVSTPSSSAPAKDLNSLGKGSTGQAPTHDAHGSRANSLPHQSAVAQQTPPILANNLPRSIAMQQVPGSAQNVNLAAVPSGLLLPNKAIYASSEPTLKQGAPTTEPRSKTGAQPKPKAKPKYNGKARQNGVSHHTPAFLLAKAQAEAAQAQGGRPSATQSSVPPLATGQGVIQASATPLTKFKSHAEAAEETLRIMRTPLAPGVAAPKWCTVGGGTPPGYEPTKYRGWVPYGER